LRDHPRIYYSFAVFEPGFRLRLIRANSRTRENQLLHSKHSYVTVMLMLCF